MDSIWAKRHRSLDGNDCVSLDDRPERGRIGPLVAWCTGYCMHMGVSGLLKHQKENRLAFYTVSVAWGDLCFGINAFKKQMYFFM